MPRPQQGGQVVEAEWQRPYTPVEAAKFLDTLQRVQSELPQYRSDLVDIATQARPLMPGHLQPRTLVSTIPWRCCPSLPTGSLRLAPQLLGAGGVAGRDSATSSWSASCRDSRSAAAKAGPSCQVPPPTKWRQGAAVLAQAGRHLHCLPGHPTRLRAVAPLLIASIATRPPGVVSWERRGQASGSSRGGARRGRRSGVRRSVRVFP